MDARARVRTLRLRSFLVGLALAALAIAAAASVLGPATSGPDAAAVHFTLLAVGDTGRQSRWVEALDGQNIVARGLEWADASSQTDALVLLGDNFYWKGLERGAIAQRIVENVVAPYCRFVELDGLRSSRVARGCKRPDAERHPVPIFAVLGNHDYGSEESPRLESTVLSSYVSNWTLPSEVARAFDLRNGVSLVLVDSSRLLASPPSELVAALREAHGPWRILVAHHPVGTSDEIGHESGLGEGYTQRVREAMAEAGVPVQLMLAGHEHNLQVIQLQPGRPPLVVVAGSGSAIRPVTSRSPGRRFGEAALGFARVQLIGAGAEARLIVSLYVTPRWTSAFGRSPIERARWSVGLRGDTRDEHAVALVAAAP